MPEQPQQLNTQAQLNAQRERLFVTIARITLVMLALLLSVYVAAGFLVPGFPAGVLSGINVVAGLLVGLTLFWRRYAPQRAIALYLVSVNLLILGAIPFLGGVSGPLMIALVVLVLLAGLLWGRIGLRVVVTLQGSGLVVLSAMQLSGWVRPYIIPAGIFNYGLYVTLSGAAIGMTVIVLLQFIHMTRQSLELAQERGRELTAALAEIQSAAQSEREVQRDQEAAALRRELLVRQYVDFLQQVARGNYKAHLDLELPTTDAAATDDLLNLGRYLNETVLSLVTALSDLQLVQQRYLGEAWESFLQSETVQSAYRYRGTRLEPAPDVRVSGKLGELAIPITVREQQIGLLGVRRGAVAEWSDADRELVEAIAYQLGQTLDNLRLVEQTQRAAVRERLVADVTGAMRQSLDVDQVLQTALRAMADAFDLDAVEVRLGQTLAPTVEEVLV